MPESPAYTHPTFDHFLQFHLGLVGKMEGEGETKWKPREVMDALDRKDFPFSHTCTGGEVFVLEGSKHHGTDLTLICNQGEPTTKVIEYLAGRAYSDRENNRATKYGPLVLKTTHHPEKLVSYFDRAVRSLFKDSVARTLFADPTTMKTSWYGRVNAFDQKKYLEEIIDQVVQLHGISVLLTSQLNTQRGGTILTDSARAASLAIALMRLLNSRASDQVIYTLGLTCFVQHFGALFNNEQEYYPGKVYDKPNPATLEILNKLGVNGDNKQPLAGIDANIFEVLRILRYRQGASKPTALYHVFSIVNNIVATYFTERRREQDKKGAYTISRNPSFNNVDSTMETLDKRFAETGFYHYHREKIERFLFNADRYFRLHVKSSLSKGGHISTIERKALRAS